MVVGDTYVVEGMDAMGLEIRTYDLVALAVLACIKQESAARGRHYKRAIALTDIQAMDLEVGRAARRGETRHKTAYCDNCTKKAALELHYADTCR